MRGGVPVGPAVVPIVVERHGALLIDPVGLVHRVRGGAQRSRPLFVVTGIDGGRLLEEVGDFLGLQRQQLDALTVSFSTLAGGVPGDGLGSQLVRWTAKANFVPKPPTENPS